MTLTVREKNQGEGVMDETLIGSCTTTMPEILKPDKAGKHLGESANNNKIY